MTASPTDSLVIGLHGVGSSGRDLAPLAAALRPALARTAFAFPDAPSRFDAGPGRQWFSVTAVTTANRSARIEESRAAFNRVLEAEIAKHGFLGRLDRVALFGFSQGSIMALDAIATGRWPVAAVVAASGRLATPLASAVEANTRVLLIHGEDDPVIPAQESRAAADRLSERGFDAEVEIYPRLGHGLSAEGVQRAGTFLASVFAN